MKYVALTGFVTLYIAVLPVLILYLLGDLAVRRVRQDALTARVA